MTTRVRRLRSDDGQLIGALREVESLSHADTACVALSVVQFALNIAT